MLRLNAYRGLTETMKSGVPGPEGSLGKWQWADINQSLTELAMDIRGPARAARRRRRGRTASCAPAPTRSRAAPPRSSRTSSPSASWACRGCDELRPHRRAAGDQGDRARVPRRALQVGGDPAAGAGGRAGSTDEHWDGDGRARLAGDLRRRGGGGRASASSSWRSSPRRWATRWRPRRSSPTPARPALAAAGRAARAVPAPAGRRGRGAPSRCGTRAGARPRRRSPGAARLVLTARRSRSRTRQRRLHLGRGARPPPTWSSAADGGSSPRPRSIPTRRLFTVRFDGGRTASSRARLRTRLARAISAIAGAGRRVDRRRRSGRWRWRSSTPRTASSSARRSAPTRRSRTAAPRCCWRPRTRARRLRRGMGARPRARVGAAGRIDGEGLRVGCRLARDRVRDPGPRRHRLHLGARPPLLPQARQGQRARLRRRPVAPRARGGPRRS